MRRPALRPLQPEIQRFELSTTGAQEHGAIDAHVPAAEAASLLEGCKPAAACRWVIPAGGTVAVSVCFQSQDIGIFHENITFEVKSIIRDTQHYHRLPKLDPGSHMFVGQFVQSVCGLS